jgi:superfamily II DNA or RNA helicase
MNDESDLPNRLQAVLAERLALEEEVRQLKELLSQNAIALPPQRPISVPGCLPIQSEIAQIPAPASKEKRVTLFRSLFRGREDVYALRWRMKDGTWGYRPADQKDWDAINASRPEDRKKVTRLTRQLLPLTDQVVRLHLTGKQTIGIYPLLQDDTCWLLAADFDKKTWQEDALAFIVTCGKLRVPAYLERSRSGNGAHVWIFFENAVPAILARKMGCAILTQTMERRYQVGLNSYDRFFPNQDTLPNGGFGNLIALPLQWMARLAGNSVFVDGSLVPYPDQWQLMASVRRASADQVDWIVNDAARRGQVMGLRMPLSDDDALPWMLPPTNRSPDKPISGPFPDNVVVVRSNMIFVPKEGMPPAMLDRLLRLAAFQNPEFYRTQAMRLPVWDKPRVISCAEDFTKYIALPRGCLQEIEQLLRDHRIRFSITDERYAGKPIEAAFEGELREDQAKAVEKALRHDEGVLCAPTAFGKTVVASKLIAERRVNTLVLVHRRQLLDQWRERLSMFLKMPSKSIGQIVGGKAARSGIVDVAVIQSLHHKGEVKDFVAEYGHVIVDECHHLSAFTFERVMKQVKAKYVVGLTATPTRKDGHQPIIFMQCGPIRFNISAREAAARSPFEHLVVSKTTGFRMEAEPGQPTIQDIYAALVIDPIRNQQIVDDLLEAIRRGLTPLVLTNRTDHIERLALGLTGLDNVIILKGGMGKKQRQALAAQLAAIGDGKPRVILATGSYIGEGFDDSRLDALFLTMPISWRGTLQQYVGRLHRIHHGKKTVRVFDYVDEQVPMLARMYEKRLKGYRAIGYGLEADPAGSVLL